jgi:hypothetical protein
MNHNHWAMHSHWLWIMRYAEPVVCESLCAMLYQCSWIMESYAQLLVMNHGELYWTSGWESCRVMMSQWLWIMASHAVPVVVNHVVQCLANGCQSWRIMLCQWLWIMLCYVEPVVLNHDVKSVPVGVDHAVLYCASRWESRCEHCASRCESWWVMLSQWLWITY